MCQCQKFSLLLYQSLCTGILNSPRELGKLISNFHTYSWKVRYVSLAWQNKRELIKDAWFLIFTLASDRSWTWNKSQSLQLNNCTVEKSLMNVLVTSVVILSMKQFISSSWCISLWFQNHWYGEDNNLKITKCRSVEILTSNNLSFTAWV